MSDAIKIQLLECLDINALGSLVRLQQSLEANLLSKGSFLEGGENGGDDASSNFCTIPATRGPIGDFSLRLRGLVGCDVPRSLQTISVCR